MAGKGLGTTDDWLMRVQMGLVTGHKVMRGMGEREAIGTTATGEDLWRGNELSAPHGARQ